ncbi:MAG: hypothetical protein ABSH08_10145 [Tepidisphaeraceae bacterium]
MIPTIVSPLLAEDWGPIILLAFFVPVGLGVITFGSVIVNKYWGRRKWWGLTLALIPTLLGGLIWFYFLTVTGGAPIFFHLAAAFPFLCGIWSIILWSQPLET